MRVDHIKPRDGLVTRALVQGSPVHLPANAAGVIYQSNSVLDAGAFTIDEEGGKAGLAPQPRRSGSAGRRVPRNRHP